jgi:5-methylcytosine-specific restriction endonuclease McrA
MNELKSRMGIPRDVYGSIDISVSSGGLTQRELERIVSSGIDIPEKSLKVLDDGTLAYKDTRVILYIRDVAHYGGNTSDPKYHLGNCATLQNMRQGDRFERYVVSTRLDGYFLINLIKGNEARRKDAKLLVCQNCLSLLKFSGFNYGWSKTRKTQFVSAFSIREFFEKYPMSLHGKLPKYNSITAPENVYTKNFDDISKRLRDENNWTCQECGINLSSSKRYLHVHHVDGQKSNNERSNLRVLCIGCHSKKYNHAHINSLPEYREFTEKFPGWCN